MKPHVGAILYNILSTAPKTNAITMRFSAVFRHSFSRFESTIHMYNDKEDT